MQEAVKNCTENLRVHMLQALLWAMAAEFRHVHEVDFFRYLEDEPKQNKERLEELIGIDASKFLLAYLKKYYTKELNVLSYFNPKKKDFSLYSGPLRSEIPEIRSESRHGDYGKSYSIMLDLQKELNFSLLELGQILFRIFLDLQWMSGYGGKAWANIADGYVKLLKASTLQDRIIYIDHAYDLQHNNDTVFTKLKSYYKDSGYEWIRLALDWKREATDIRGFYEKVSGSLKPIVARIAKEIHNLTMEDFPKDDGVKGAATDKEKKKERLAAFFIRNQWYVWKDIAVEDSTYYEGVCTGEPIYCFYKIKILL